MWLLVSLFGFLVFTIGGPVFDPSSDYYTPLDEYVARPDSNYRYVAYPQYNFSGPGWKGYTVMMYSQQWLTPADWNRGNASNSDAIWWHWMTIIIPEILDPAKSEYAFLWITGGSNNANNPPIDPYSEDNGLLTVECLEMGVVGAALYQIPNQPIYFTDDPSNKGRSEDALIAWTWKHFLDQSNETDWPARLPMTKASVRAMDTLADYVKATQTITKFMVSGASKRGWTTWTTALVDDRVSLIVPIVLDALHMIPSLHHMWRAYGGWTFALSDYYDVNITGRIDEAGFEWLSSIVDPYYYLPDPTRLRMPKLVINAAGDEFLQGDNDFYWWDFMPEPKFRQMDQNAEHSEATSIIEIIGTVGAWVNTWFIGGKWPNITWSIDPNNGSITAWNNLPSFKPINVTAWSAESAKSGLRDWRLLRGNATVQIPQAIIWSPTPLKETYPGTNMYYIEFEQPKTHWLGFFMEFFFEGPTRWNDPTKTNIFRLTTQMSYIPKNVWYTTECYGWGCYGTLV
jgi:PhoPQ-activated pathogenicity-related protein